MATFTLTLEPWEIAVLRGETNLTFTVKGDQVSFPNQARYPLAGRLEKVLDFGDITAYEALGQNYV